MRISYLKIIVAVLSLCIILTLTALIWTGFHREKSSSLSETEAAPPQGETNATSALDTAKLLHIESYAFIQSNPFISPGDYCDVRILFPSGENYIIMEKKRLLAAEGSIICFQVSEYEIMKMSSALYDVNHYMGTCVYLTKYGSDLQAASISDYPVNPAVYALCQWNPNLTGEEAKKTMNYRAALEKNLN